MQAREEGGASRPPPAKPEEEADAAPAAAVSGATGREKEEAGPNTGEAGIWPDESAEAAFLADARERGELPLPAKPREEIAEEADARPLPALDDLVQRIPPEVRETLDDLFRARFVRVVRVPRKALNR